MADLSSCQLVDLVTCAGVLLLVYFLLVKPNYNVSVSAKGFYPGGTLANIASQKSDSSGDFSHAESARNGFSNGAMELPSFWETNEVLNDSQKGSIRVEPDSGKDGMRNSARYVEGMSKFNRNDLLSAMQGQ